MYTQVTRDQFQINDEVIIHRPTRTEFTPTLGHADSVTIWTGEIGNRLPSGEVYRYAEVMALMKTLWRELNHPRFSLKFLCTSHGLPLSLRVRSALGSNRRAMHRNGVTD